MPEKCETCDRMESATLNQGRAISQMHEAIKRAHSLIDQAMGDTDPLDPDDPLLKAAQTLAPYLSI